MRGPGKYDDALTVAREMCGSDAAILIVQRGNKGPGFSVQADAGLIRAIPAMLRIVAHEIEEDLKRDAKAGN